MKILLVDDEKKFVSSLAERLSIRGIEADWVTSGEEALSKAKVNRYDLAVLDLKMPHIGGIELKETLEKMDPDMKYILVTGHGSEEAYKKGCEEAFCCIIKPFKIDFLIEKIEQAVNQ